MRRLSLRTLLLVFCASLVGVAAALWLRGWHSGRPVVPVQAAREMQLGRQYEDSLIHLTRSAQSPAQLTAEGAVAIGYLERHRLGLGSPFRLMAYAMRDPRLSDTTRSRVAWALLARTYSGAGYELEPAALDHVGGEGADWRPGVGGWHAAFIDSIVRSARDPRGGELAVRAAYRIARAEGSVGRRAPMITAQAAALARDRTLAATDARSLLRAAYDQEVDALSLIGPWRESRRFTVERPAMEPLAASVEDAALISVPSAVVRLRAHARDTTPSERVAQTASYLGPAAALRLAELQSVRSAPPQAPIGVAVRSYRSMVISSASGPLREVRRRFVDRARTEESLAAELALAAASSPVRRSGLALTSLLASVSMRAYGQESVWFSGDPAPTVKDVKKRYGLSSVTFDENVPESWRPYFLRLLVSAVDDLHTVMPVFSLRGMGVHFGESVAGETALAMHDPASRTVYLPLATSAGAIAHELAHDLDWQAARRATMVAGDYWTDRAVRERREAIAAPLRSLSAAELIAPAPDNRHRAPHAQRPAEVFARNVDWFVTSSLARQGRTNGYLSSVQDEVLTGYAGVTAPDVSGEGAEAVIEILRDMVLLDDRVRDEFLAAHGRARSYSGWDVLRQVLEVAPPSGWEEQILPSRARTGLSLTADISELRRGACRPTDDVPGSAARRAVEELGADARARGLLRVMLRRAALEADSAGVVGPRAVPEPTDVMVERLRAKLLELARSDAAERASAAGPLARWTSPACPSLQPLERP